MGQPLTIWEHARLQGHSRRDFLKFCAWLTAAAGIDSSAMGDVVHALETKPTASRGLVPLPGMHLLQRVLHPLVAPDRRRHHSRQDLPRLHRRPCRPPPASRPRSALHDTMKKYPASTSCWSRARCPPATTASTASSPGAPPWRSSRRPPPAPRPSSPGAAAPPTAASRPPARTRPAPRRSTRSSRQARHQRAGLPAHRATSWPAIIVHILVFGTIPRAGRPGPPEGVLLPPRPRHLLPPSQLRRRPVRGGLGRRERPQGLLPLQDGLPRAGHLQRLRGDHAGTAASAIPIQSGHGCIGCSEANFWDNGPFYQHLAAFPGFGIETTADKIGVVGRRGHGGGRGRPCRQHQHPQARS